MKIKNKDVILQIEDEIRIILIKNYELKLKLYNLGQFIIDSKMGDQFYNLKNDFNYFGIFRMRHSLIDIVDDCNNLQ